LGLFLANRWGWHATFYFIVAACAMTLPVVARAFPSLREHLLHHGDQDALRRLLGVVAHGGHLRAFALSALIVLAGFTVIPFISPYAVKNVGLKETDLPLIYIFGGAFTVFTMPAIGRLADRFGRMRVFTIMATLAGLVTLWLTHLPKWSVAAVITVTTLFMICMSGRFVPAFAMIMASVEPRYRGGFMSVNSSVQSVFAGVGSFVSGLIIKESVTGELAGYGTVGWLSVGLMASCIPMAAQLRPVAPVKADERVAEAMATEGT
jgi:predicted MFS family arabinose efflux permease